MAGTLEEMRSEVSTMTTVDAHAHFLPDFYRMPFSSRVCARRPGQPSCLAWEENV
jgi:hypothetical protein